MVYIRNSYTRIVLKRTCQTADRDEKLMFLQGHRRFVMKKRINITLEDEVVRRVDRYADEHYTSRSGAITMLIVEATDKPASGNKAGRRTS